jgi:hypothetical protein
MNGDWPLLTDRDEAVRLFDRAVQHHLSITPRRCRGLPAQSPLNSRRSCGDPCLRGAVHAHRRGEHAKVVDLLAPRRGQIRLLADRNAQRDLFFQMPVDPADAGRPRRCGNPNDRPRNRHARRTPEGASQICRGGAMATILDTLMTPL